MRQILLCAFIWTAAVWPAAGHAQDMFWSTTLPAITGTDTLGLHLRELREQQPNGGQRRAQPNPVPGTPSAAAFRYTPSPQRRAANLAQFVAKSRQNDPRGADDLARLFASGDVIEKMRAPLAKVGLRVDDVADAYTVYWVNAWQASRGVDYEISRHTATAVRSQVAGVMASTGALRGAGDAARQEMAESLLIQAMLIEAAVQQSKGNPELGHQLATAVSQGARGMNLDLAGMTLTEDGFVSED
ncbi:hypothetical protein FFK22_006140 [Mycobacterium sp. KBS0706]|uniref:DUF6683 family protein n=1 Tax=Mycobacterium sp. KBS0706 TaxID=2578109 RepID=UPI00110FEDB9|nr:DUF6683 family protein [Mycobacterium sp. KBS0706]TSD89582.1 hypothetical protein FFK22_006140 [Mycobacterium sp. KBS0706]